MPYGLEFDFSLSGGCLESDLTITLFFGGLVIV
jgi:hypothetical protein